MSSGLSRSQVYQLYILAICHTCESLMLCFHDILNTATSRKSKQHAAAYCSFIRCFSCYISLRIARSRPSEVKMGRLALTILVWLDGSLLKRRSCSLHGMIWIRTVEINADNWLIKLHGHSCGVVALSPVVPAHLSIFGMW